MKSTRKLLFYPCLCIGLAGNSFAQTFTKLGTGAIVTDGTSTFGSSWVDIDQDDDLDLFITNVYTENDRFYFNNGSGNFTLASPTIGTLISDGKQSYSSTWGDYDNDGFEDVYITYGASNNAINSLYHNNGNGTFTKITAGIPVNDPAFSDGASWADYDNDSYLDLYVTHVNSTANALYHNNGNGTFTKITTGAIATDIAPTSSSAAWGDYDNDGFPDLFVSNFGGTNFLYHNDGNGTFTKITTGNIVTDIGHTQSASWGDYDNDGYLDLYAACTYGQNDLLYHNNGNGTFTKITGVVPAINGGYSTGSTWGDYDNDGDLDLFVCNSSADSPINEYNQLFDNNGNGTFSLVTTGTFQTDISNGRGATWADYDNDGDLDLHVANEVSTNDFIYKNNGNANHWINIKCYGINSNKSAIGTRISVKAIINGSAVWQNNFISAQTGYAGQNSLNVEFGFADATVIDSIVVRWPSGLVCYYTGISTDQFIKIYENCTLTGLENVADKQNNLIVYTNPFEDRLNVTINSTRASDSKIYLTDIAGREVIVKEIRLSSGKNKVELSTTWLNAGAYFLTVEYGTKKDVIKVLVK